MTTESNFQIEIPIQLFHNPEKKPYKPKLNFLCVTAKVILFKGQKLNVKLLMNSLEGGFKKVTIIVLSIQAEEEKYIKSVI